MSTHHLSSRELSRGEVDSGRDFTRGDFSSTSLGERGRQAVPYLRATSSTPTFHHRSRSRDSIYSGKQSHRPRSPDLSLKPLRPAIRFPPGFEFVDNTYTPSASVLELASSSSQPTANSSLENLGHPSSAPSSPSQSPKVPKVQVNGSQPKGKQAKRHPASILAKVARPESPNTRATSGLPIHVEDNESPEASTTPTQVAFEPSSSDGAAPVPPAQIPDASLPAPQVTKQWPRASSEVSSTNDVASVYSPSIDEATEVAPQKKDDSVLDGDESSSKRRSLLSRWRNRQNQSNLETKDEGAGSQGLLRHASTLLRNENRKASGGDPLPEVAESEAEQRQRWAKSVGFDTMPDALDTASESFSFTLQAKTKGYQRSKNTRLFMCAVDANSYSETALAWCMEQLVEDGDEVIAVRVVEGEKEDLDQDAIRHQARDLVAQVAEMNDEVPGRKISIVVEFIHGRPTSTILRLIQAYRPNSLTVGTRGKSANALQKLIGGAPMIGHVSRDILQRSPVPVVVVRPEAKVRKHLNKRLRDPSKRAYRNLVISDTP